MSTLNTIGNAIVFLLNYSYILVILAILFLAWVKRMAGKSKTIATIDKAGQAAANAVAKWWVVFVYIGFFIAGLLSNMTFSISGVRWGGVHKQVYGVGKSLWNSDPIDFLTNLLILLTLSIILGIFARFATKSPFISYLAVYLCATSAPEYVVDLTGESQAFSSSQLDPTIKVFTGSFVILILVISVYVRTGKNKLVKTEIENKPEKRKEEAIQRFVPQKDPFAYLNISLGSLISVPFEGMANWLDQPRMPIQFPHMVLMLRDSVPSFDLSKISLPSCELPKISLNSSEISATCGKIMSGLNPMQSGIIAACSEIHTRHREAKAAKKKTLEGLSAMQTEISSITEAAIKLQKSFKHSSEALTISSEIPIPKPGKQYKEGHFYRRKRDKAEFIFRGGEFHPIYQQNDGYINDEGQLLRSKSNTIVKEKLEKKRKTMLVVLASILAVLIIIGVIFGSLYLIVYAIEYTIREHTLLMIDIAAKLILWSIIGLFSFVASKWSKDILKPKNTKDWFVVWTVVFALMQLACILGYFYGFPILAIQILSYLTGVLNIWKAMAAAGKLKKQ